MRALFLFFILTFLAGCSSSGSKDSSPSAAAGESSAPKQAGKVVVATAANVQYAMDELELAFEAETGLELEAIIGSSGKLTAQIQQGAPYDLLISADMKYPQYLHDNGLAADPPRVYAKGTLVLWTTKELNLDRPISAILRDAAVQKIAVANPKNAPYGVQAIKLLGNLNLLETLRPQLVYGESIAQTNQYITSGACELGFTAKSVVLSPLVTETGTWMEPDRSLYDPIEQGVVITRHGRENNSEASERFFDFLFSTQGKEVLKKFGYELPEND